MVAALEPQFQPWSVKFDSGAQPKGDVEVDVMRFPVPSVKSPLQLEYFNPETKEWEPQGTPVRSTMVRSMHYLACSLE